jgi:cytochrome c biogenesis factor
MRNYFIGFIKSVLKKQVNQGDLKIPVYLSNEQNKKYVVGNVILWMVTAFLIGAGLLNTTSKNITEFKFFNGLIFSLMGTIFYLIYIKVKKNWTTAEIKKTYQRNLVGALIVIGIVFLFNISRINLDTSPVTAWLELVVLSIFFMMYMSNKKSANHAFAIYALIPIATDFIFGSNGSTMIWAFGFLVSAKSILINEVINSEST